MNDADRNVDELCQRAERCWAEDRPHEALEAAWAAFELHANKRTRRLVAKLLEHYANALSTERRDDYLALLKHREVEPDLISTAGWRLFIRSHSFADTADDDAFRAFADALERNTLSLALLRESPVYFAAAERILTRLRRWLLLSGAWRDYPELVAALKIQTGLNGGAWPFDEKERAALAAADNSPMAPTYSPAQRSAGHAAESPNSITRAVAAQYEVWPYPAWTRITMGPTRRLPDVVRRMDPEIAAALPVAAEMLIAGCGTGRQAAYIALQFPESTITAIDVSQASLDYARRQCRSLGVANVHFAQLDLHNVAELGQSFHAIHCAGVLHHLPDPERGLELLAQTLHPRGVMHLMVYNRLQRLTIAAARTLIADLVREPITDDLLRCVRHRLLQQPEQSVAARLISSNDFGTLAGTHDLILHRHEDPFDVTRIEQALKRAGLRMLRFDMRTPAMAARYDAAFPDDPGHRDMKAWARFTRTDPDAIPDHYRFWCCKTQ